MLLYYCFSVINLQMYTKYIIYTFIFILIYLFCARFFFCSRRTIDFNDDDDYGDDYSLTTFRHIDMYNLIVGV